MKKIVFFFFLICAIKMQAQVVKVYTTQNEYVNTFIFHPMPYETEKGSYIDYESFLKEVYPFWKQQGFILHHSSESFSKALQAYDEIITGVTFSDACIDSGLKFENSEDSVFYQTLWKVYSKGKLNSIFNNK